MGRGISAGGGQSSLGYLSGSGETPNKPQASQNKGQGSNEPPQKSAAAAASQPIDNSKQIPEGINSSNANNYFRTDGQNCGNLSRIDLQPKFMLPLVVVLPLVTSLVAVGSDIFYTTDQFNYSWFAHNSLYFQKWISISQNPL